MRRFWTAGFVFCLMPFFLQPPQASAEECDLRAVANILAGDGNASDGFGTSVSVSGETAIIGSPRNEGNSFDAGAVYVYELVGSVWTFEAKLLPDGFLPSVRFGNSVALDGDLAVIGASRDSSVEDGAGSAFIFRRTNGVWMQEAKLFAPDFARNDRFGSSVSIDGETVVIGADENGENGNDSGAAYVFSYSNQQWAFQGKLLAADGAADDEFGHSVDISGDSIVVGAHRKDTAENVIQAGAAYIFTRVGDAWIEEAKLMSDVPVIGYEFGKSVSIDNDSVAVGTPGDSGAEGSVSVFQRIDGSWSTEDRLFADFGSSLDFFGSSVAIEGDALLVGANNYAGGFGAAYAFGFEDGAWVQQARLNTQTFDSTGRFGSSVSLNGSNMIVGSLLDNTNEIRAGAASIFTTQCDSCIVDYNSSGSLDFFDVSLFLEAFQSGYPVADLNHDGNYDFFDISLFLIDFAVGCP